MNKKTYGIDLGSNYVVISEIEEKFKSKPVIIENGLSMNKTEYFILFPFLIILFYSILLLFLGLECHLRNMTIGMELTL